ncbi:mutant gag-pol polyprotein [Gossypium australe]|uniref:Mutant gag-pol polyprotein n=1 Tax=Gossypium australe TaxID=47621 RepID=A0A5B6W987_9ROSI|nr:mutant gag-pol polyprotein [Gossypium australe]
MARFLLGLNQEITNHYVELTDMVHMAIKFERQIKKKSVSRMVFNTGSTLKWGQTSYKKDITT